MSQAYFEATIKTTEVAADVMADLLTEQGALGTATEAPSDILELIQAPDAMLVTDEDYIQNLPDYVAIKAWFDATQYDAPTITTIVSSICDQIRPHLPVGEGLTQIVCIEAKDWEHQWKAFFHAFRVTPNVWICPSWEADDLVTDQDVIYMDPGSAFGTGKHASTALMLSLMERLIQPQDLVLDLGTGSGVLAIRAIQLGARFCDALDIDPKAVVVAQENLQHNGMADQISARAGTLETIAPEKQYRVILMNITADAIKQLATDVRDYLRDDGDLILSGIIASREAELVQYLESVGFRCRQIIHEDDWIGIHCTLG